MPTVIFSTTNWPISWLIRTVEGVPFSHCALGTAHGTVIEASVAGVHRSWRCDWEKKNRVVAEFDAPMANVAAAEREIGKRYDYPALLGFGLVVPLSRWAGFKLANPLASPKALVCSELVALSLVGMRQMENVDPGQVTPKELFAICSGAMRRIR
jgi:hypothetical protein